MEKANPPTDTDQTDTDQSRARPSDAQLATITHSTIVQYLDSLRMSGLRTIPRIPRYEPPEVRVPATPGVASSGGELPEHPVAAASSQASVNKSPIKREARMSPEESSKSLQVLASEVQGCTLCTELAETRTQTVFGVGNPTARLVFFGEAPGADEDRQGEPFVGRAGQLLTKIIEACTLQREDVYIMNVLKCRPPGNRNPLPEEATNCRSYFERQLEIIQPEFICCLGAIATTTLLETKTAIGALRGKFHEWRGIRVVATYHPAYLLRNPPAKKLVWEDMKMLMKAMGIKVPA